MVFLYAGCTLIAMPLRLLYHVLRFISGYGWGIGYVLPWLEDSTSIATCLCMFIYRFSDTGILDTIFLAGAKISDVNFGQKLEVGECTRRLYVMLYNVMVENKIQKTSQT